MGVAKQMLFARNLINICIDSVENADYQGKIWHQYSDEPVCFESGVKLLVMMDELMDEWGFPQKGLEQRSLIGRGKKRHNRQKDNEMSIDKVQKTNGTKNIQNKKGKLGTYIVQVSFRQNATWQGHVVCVNCNEKKDFTSAMELIKIIEQDLGNVDEKAE